MEYSSSVASTTASAFTNCAEAATTASSAAFLPYRPPMLLGGKMLGPLPRQYKEQQQQQEQVPDDEDLDRILYLIGPE